MNERAWPSPERWSADEDQAFRPWATGLGAVQPGKLIFGTPGDDSLHGGRGDDTIDGGEGADQMAGRKGDDTYIVDNTGDVVVELDHQGTDTVMASVDYTLADHVERLVLTGTADLDGYGNAGDNRLTGNGGANWLDGQAGADTMAGGLGDDVYGVNDAGDVVREEAGGGVDTVQSSIDYVLPRHVENLSLVEANYPFHLNGTGNERDNRIDGTVGNNRLEGLGGDDYIDSGGLIGPYGSDTLIGGLGNDTLVGGGAVMGDDSLYGGAGDDVLQVSEGANALYGEDGDDLLEAGSGGPYGAADWLSGGAGRDTLDGGGGLDGGDGDDLMYTTYATGSASGGLGNDTIQGSGGSGYSNLYVDGGGGKDQIDVFSINNRLILTGGDGSDILRGGAGMGVSIDGGLGNDLITGYKLYPGGPLSVRGGEGSDTIEGSGAGDLLLYGDAGHDLIQAIGQAGYRVTVDGGEGDDTLSGFGGLVELLGGAGSDTFVLTERDAVDANEVWAQDFVSGVDRLAVSQSTLAVGNGDLVVDGGTVIAGPGGFDASAELVIVTGDMDDGGLLEQAAIAIGQADQAYAAGQTAVFIVDDGSKSYALYFESSGADATVSADELSVIGLLLTTPSTGLGDIVWTA
jgi:Ca2+-binding RTX toxin-like protein